MKKKISTWQRKSKKFMTKHRAKVRSVIIVSSIAIVGAIVLIVTKAAVPFASIEPEKGSNITADVLSGNGSSGNQYVKFANRNTGGGGSAATGKFYIVGKDIVDPDGNIFVPMGANGGMAPGWMFGYFGKFNGQVNNVKTWGWNTIRPNIGCAPTSNPTRAEVMTGLDQLINEYTSQKIVVMITCRVDVGVDYYYNSPSIQAALPMIKEIAQKYKNNPYVWMNPFNEPTSSQGAWIPLNQPLYDDVRALAPDMVYVGDLAGLGNQIDALSDGNLATTFGSGKCNVTYGWHSYGFIYGYGTDATHQAHINKLVAKNISVVVGEFGDPIKDNGSPLMASDPPVPGVAGNPEQNRIGANAVMKYGYPAGYGLIWWIATGDNNNTITYSLTKDKTSPWTVNTGNAASKLAPAGKMFWDLTHPTPAKKKFTGNVANSGCASAR